MIGKNIKKYRLLNGWSLRELASKLGVSHETVKKYEDNILTPNSTRIIEMAKIFNVSISDLMYVYNSPKLEYKNFRKGKLSAKKCEGLKSLIEDEIQKYIEVLDFADKKISFDKDKWSFEVNDIADIEGICKNVRKYLGVSDECAVDNLTLKLEDNNFLILEIDFEEKFDGFSEMVDGLPFIILCSKGYERNRFTLAHELGHLILKFKENLTDEKIEKYCDTFAVTLLLPKTALERELDFTNNKRRNISFNEILLIAKEYKVSPTSVIMRIKKIGLITDSQEKSLFIIASKNGYKTKQLKNVEEHPMRRDKLVFQLEAQKIISVGEAVKYLGVTTDEYFRHDFDN